jgi:hypothetical protein
MLQAVVGLWKNLVGDIPENVLSNSEFYGSRRREGDGRQYIVISVAQISLRFWRSSV